MRLHYNDKNEAKNTKLVRFLHTVPKFVGKELEEYGPFAEEDIANLPLEIADLLIERGANYDFVDALLLGDTETVERALLENPDKLEEMSYFGGSLLSLAFDFGRSDTARYLLELGMDPSEVRPGRKKSLLDRAR